MISLASKAKTLEELTQKLKSARILPLFRFSVGEWINTGKAIRNSLLAIDWARDTVIVRSSAQDEDKPGKSQAGKYLSLPGIRGRDALFAAIEKVIQSFGSEDPLNEVFIQPQLSDIKLSGVAFSRDPNTGGPYIVINYDDVSGSTSSVTSGSSEELKTFYYFKSHKAFLPAPLNRVVDLIKELESLTGIDGLDVEFAIDAEGVLYCLQTRPLPLPPIPIQPEAPQRKALEETAEKIREWNQPHPYLHGERTVFGVMPDWNPAEIIGIRPRPLALSLYKEIITDNIWAYQRDGYGYKNLRSFPLLISFAGLPYIDVRVSFNSFLPKEVSDPLSEKLLNYYLNRLLHFPSHHDKVEFEIVHSCYSLDIEERMESLAKAGFSKAELEELTLSLRALTNRIINGSTGLWRKDKEKIGELENRRERILQSAMPSASKIYWLLEDCKRYGTLPFAGLARAAFIATQMLNSLVKIGVLDGNARQDFLASLNTVSSQMGHDFISLDRATFLHRYGHLRPGTYDLLSPRYDEEPERYFDWQGAKKTEQLKTKTFSLSLEQLKRIEGLLKQHRLEHDVLGLFEFIKEAIEGREYSKFIFTRSISDALSLVKTLGKDCGFSADDCSFLDIGVIKDRYASSQNIRESFGRSIASGKAAYATTCQLTLPPVISKPEEVWAFHLPPSDPNFITLKKATGHITSPGQSRERLKGSILCIPSADPGYDWIFSLGLAGFITKYGGGNSHMAIRAAEMSVPAVIGAGEALYNAWTKAELLEIDSANRKVTVIR